MISLALPFALWAVQESAPVPLPEMGPAVQARTDFLVDASAFTARAGLGVGENELVLGNGLVRRTWRLAPNGATVGYDNLTSGEAMLRSVRPEARVTIDGTEYAVGGLVGQPNHAYLAPDWLDAMTADPGAMKLVDMEIAEPEERFGWGQRRHASPGGTWPPPGKSVRMEYVMPDSAKKAHRAIRVSVHYELYDGVPVMSKWIEVHNGTEAPVTVDTFRAEELAAVEHSNWVEHRDGMAIPHPATLHVETDFAFGGFNHQNANRHAVHWRTDPLYSSQVNWARQTPCLLCVEPTYGPAQLVAPGGSFESFRVFELSHDNEDRERRGMALRRMYRTVAPWVTENPITHHLLSHDPVRVREAIDDAASVGFEAIILSFGSGFNMENEDPQFLAEWKGVADYAEAKGIELGSYSLFSSRGAGKENMIVSPDGQSPTHGQCPAVTSPWGQGWLGRMRRFYAATGFDQFENDGPYPGDVDTTERLPLQKGEADSRWVQWRHTSALYRDLRASGIFINAPDYYFLSGSNKCGMGYREVNWSLPRAEQVIHTRQNIYDGTWTKTPSMGWMFVPLSEYQGGGAAATIEPLHEHLPHYERMLYSNLAMGVQAHYRGPRLFDTEETQELVATAVAWFKRHRDILESDMVHGRRADGRDLDWMLHANPGLDKKGMLCVFNPLEKDITKTIRVDAYYTGLTNTVEIEDHLGKRSNHGLIRGRVIDLEVTVPAQGMAWYLMR